MSSGMERFEKEKKRVDYIRRNDRGQNKARKRYTKERMTWDEQQRSRRLLESVQEWGGLKMERRKQVM